MHVKLIKLTRIRRTLSKLGPLTNSSVSELYRRAVNYMQMFIIQTVHWIEKLDYFHVTKIEIKIFQLGCHESSWLKVYNFEIRKNNTHNGGIRSIRRFRVLNEKLNFSRMSDNAFSMNSFCVTDIFIVKSFVLNLFRGFNMWKFSDDL